MSESNPGSPYYQEASGSAYFETYADPLGQSGIFLNLPLFEPFVRPGDTVLDFGCGGGHLLAGLHVARRIGVDVNPFALAAARSRGLEVFDRLEDVPSESVDVVVSNHGLEHTLRPFDVLAELRRITRKGGSLVLFLPSEGWWRQRSYRPGNVDHHLYTWTPMLLGNLLDEAGWDVVTARLEFQAWPPRGYQYLRFAPRTLVRLACRLTSILLLQPQVHAFARKPD